MFSVELPAVKAHPETGQMEREAQTWRSVPVRSHPVATSFAIFDESVELTVSFRQRFQSYRVVMDVNLTFLFYVRMESECFIDSSCVV